MQPAERRVEVSCVHIYIEHMYIHIKLRLYNKRLKLSIQQLVTLTLNTKN